MDPLLTNERFSLQQVCFTCCFFPTACLALAQPNTAKAGQAVRPFAQNIWKCKAQPNVPFSYWKISAHMEKTVTSGNVNRERGLHSPSCQGLLSQLYFTVDSHKKKNWERFSCSPQHFPGRQGRSQDCRISDWKDTVGCCLLKALLLAGLLQR